MIDTRTRRPIRVSTGEDAGPYLLLPAARLEEIDSVLDANNVSYWVDEEVFSIDDNPEIAVINFHRGTDPVSVQRLLDDLP